MQITHLRVDQSLIFWFSKYKMGIFSSKKKRAFSKERLNSICMPHSQFPLEKSITTCNQENNAYSKICIKKKIKTILNNNLTKIKSQKKIRINRAVKIIIVTPPPSQTVEKNTYTKYLKGEKLENTKFNFFFR